MTDKKTESKKPTKAGFAAIIGAPNAGKSTLVNALVGEKVSIVTHKIQTTRFQVRGIAMRDYSQIVLVDTPGIFKTSARADQRLGRSMVHSAWSGVADSDIIVHVVDAPSFLRVKNGVGMTAQDKKAAADTDRVIKGLKLRANAKPVILVLNKIDQMQKQELLSLIDSFKYTGIYKDILMLSALQNEGVDTLADRLADAMPIGPFLYPPDQAADIPMRLMAAEITREKLFLRLHNELPYASYVETENWKRQQNGSLRIDQVIYVRRKSQKPIVLGKNGQTIKQIGQMARQDMQDSFGLKVHLFLFVKVRENWTEDKSKYQETGLEYDV